MKKYAFFLRTILPNINQVIPMDDGALYITFNNERDQILMDPFDYETATRQQQRIRGLVDRITGSIGCH